MSSYCLASRIRQRCANPMCESASISKSSLSHYNKSRVSSKEVIIDRQSYTYLLNY